MVKQRTEGSSFDAHVGAEQIFTIVVMVETSGGCFGKDQRRHGGFGAAGNIHGCHYISSARAEQWRHSAAGGSGSSCDNGASGDKVGGIFQNPSANSSTSSSRSRSIAARAFFPIAQQEDRHVLLALMKLTDQLSDVLMFVRMFHLIAEHQAVNGFV